MTLSSRKLLLLVALSASMFANSVLSQTLNACSNVTVGVLSGGGSTIYSDCFMNITGLVTHPALLHLPSVPLVRADSLPTNALAPAPTPSESFGTWNGLDSAFEDMGAGYSGNCTDMTLPNPTDSSSTGSVAPVDGNVYCGRYTNTIGESVWIRGTWDATGSTWLSPLLVTNKAGVGTPLSTSGASSTATPSVPVPALPVFALVALGSLLGLLGLRKIKS